MVESKMSIKNYSPEDWGVKDTPKIREILLQFITKYDDLVHILGGEGGESMTVAEYVMLVDDMEGLDLRDEIERGRFEIIDLMIREILQKYPPSRYNPFGNDFQGTPPERARGVPN